MRDPSGKTDEDTRDPKISDYGRRQAGNRSSRRRGISTGDARDTQARRGVQLAGDDLVGAESSVRQLLQGGKTPGGQVPRRIRGVKAADSGTLVQALQEAAQDRSADHHVRHLSDRGGEMRRGQREVGRLTARMPGLPQRHGCFGLDAPKSTAAN